MKTEHKNPNRDDKLKENTAASAAVKEEGSSADPSDKSCFPKPLSPEELKAKTVEEFICMLPGALLLCSAEKSGISLVFANAKAERLLGRDREGIEKELPSLITSLYGEKFSRDDSAGTTAYVERGDGSALKLLARTSVYGDNGFIMSLEDVSSRSDDLEKIDTELAKNSLLVSELEGVSFDYDPFMDRLVYVLSGEKNEKEYLSFIRNIYSIGIFPFSSAEIIETSLKELRTKPMSMEKEIRSSLGGRDSLHRLRLQSLGDKYGTVRRIIGVMCDMRSGSESEWLYQRNSMLVERSGVSILDYDVRRDIMNCTFRMDDGMLVSREYRNFYCNVLGAPFVEGKDKEKFAKTFKEVYSEGGQASLELRCSWNDRTVRWYKLDIYGISDDNGSTDHILIKASDIDSIQQMEDLVSLDKTIRSSLLRGLSMVVELNPENGDSRVIYEDKFDSKSFMPYKSYFIFGGRLENIHRDDRDAVRTEFSAQNISDVMAGGGGELFAQYRIRAASGGWIWIEVVLRLTPEKRPGGIAYIKIIDHQKRTEHELTMKAEADSMTGLLNRRSIEDKVNFSLRDVAGPGQHTVMLLDIDDFKSINDSYGHAKGDEVIIAISDMLKAEFRRADLVGRVGGDEFIVFMRGMHIKEKVVEKAEKLLAAVTESAEKFGFRVTVSIGIAEAFRDGIDFTELYASADKAMYKAKKKGKNSYSF